ncbi:MAG: glycosyltransferase family 4 protein, partial [Oligoflexia bacterium]|nr:glycosyltransferase family 4 protein [Oligoflexia bacterium]
MKIAFLNSGLQMRGGADRWLLNAITALRQAWPGLETTLLVGREDPALPGHEREGIGPVQRVKGLDRRGLRTSGAKAATRRLDQALDRLQPDRVHCNDIVDPDLLALVAATGRGVATVQDHRHFCPGPGKVLPDGEACTHRLGPACAACLPDAEYRARLLDLTARRLAALRQMRTVTVLSPYMQAELAAEGVQASVTPPMVDYLPRLPRRPPRHHLFVGRLARHKGIHVALQAASMTTLPLVVAGDGPVDVPGSRGWVDRRQLAELLAEAASLWVPSLWAEPFGIVGLEALTAGVPVIGTDRGGMGAWLVHEQTGLVVP